ncbi:HU family DNA-binding protein [Pseudophaeobacter sp. EL27]|uniref:HU family DNA-binding protein n=1 Tax=Pseudophaeobacter sp. EL27 TaxID=2107580 RepID=UPI000EFD7133|nr:HU family DNA-binding protein [Pseudophaeobacter sp. EL27]
MTKSFQSRRTSLAPKRSERAARAGRNPSTGEAIQIAAASSLTFKQAKAVKEQLNS